MKSTSDQRILAAAAKKSRRTLRSSWSARVIVAREGVRMSCALHRGVIALGLALVGCQSQPTIARFAPSDAQQEAGAAVNAPPSTGPSDRAIERADVKSASLGPKPSPATTLQVSHHEAAPVATPEADDPFPGATELPLDGLVAAVEQRNPSLAGMVAAWQAAAQRYPQVVALDDPMFQFVMAPASFGASQVEPAYAIQVDQKFPWKGKLAARGAAARAEANAAGFDVEDSRVRLAEATRYSFLDYYLAQRTLELNGENIRVMREFRETAQNKYQLTQVTEQDVLQADVELAELDRRRIELVRMNRVAVARINTLLRRRPNAALPPAPRRLTALDSIPSAEILEQIALERRPDLAALRSRVDAEQAAVTLACKQYCPDVDVFGRFDKFWQPTSQFAPLQGQIGVNVNLPIYRGKLNAAVSEAMFRLNQRRAEYDQRVLDIQYEVQSAYEQVLESEKTAKLYADRIIPAAEQNVAVARTNYDVGKSTFLALAQSQRQLIDLREKQQEAVANLHRRMAELERAIAGPLVENSRVVNDRAQ